MKSRKLSLVFFLSFIVTSCLFAQKISYSYDAAGNRVSRKYKTVLLRSAQAPASEKLDSVIETAIENLTVSVYPNPTKGNLSVVMTGITDLEKAVLRLYNAKGEPLQIIHIVDGTTPVHMWDYSPGWYILRVDVGKKNIDFKIIKE